MRAVEIKAARKRRMRRFCRNQRQLLFFFLSLVLTSIAVTRERALWSKARSSDWWDRIVNQTFDDNNWRENFRMSRATFLYICNELRGRLQRKDTVMRRSISVEKRVAITLWKLATNNNYRSIAHLFGVSKAMVCINVQEVCQSIVEILMPQYIKIPEGERLKETISIFESKWGFPQCDGAVDGSHIPIMAPEEYHTDYFNRKGWHSVILQGSVGPNYTFWDINVGWPGSVHDARVLANTDVYKKAVESKLFPPWTRTIHGTEIPTVIIGDPAYPLLSWLMKPFSDTGRLSRQQQNFVVENVYGRLKGRWRCLLKRNDCKLESVQVQVASCCTLNNICEVHGERFNEDLGNFTQDPQFSQPASATSQRASNERAETVRNALMNYFSSNQSQ